jgi:hypothetical protein
MQRPDIPPETHRNPALPAPWGEGGSPLSVHAATERDRAARRARRDVLGAIARELRHRGGRDAV